MLLKLYLVSQFLLKLAEIWTRQSSDDLEEIQKGFLKIQIFSDFILIFHLDIANFVILDLGFTGWGP